MKADQQIYRQLYRIQAENREAAGSPLKLSEEQFILYSQAEPDRTNLGLLEGISREDFLDSAVIAVLHRQLDEETRNDWESRYADRDEAGYKQAIIKNVMATPERSQKAIRIYNNVFEEGQVKKAASSSKLRKLKDFAYHKIYAKLPTGLRKSVRNVGRKLRGW